MTLFGDSRSCSFLIEGGLKMDDVITVLAPVFVASLALQQLLELLDPVLDVFLKPHKKWILSAVTLVVGVLLAMLLDLRILSGLGLSVNRILDLLLTAFFLMGGTKGINDLMKLIGYRKEQVKGDLTSEQVARV
jgi:hypothetical protein